VIVLKKIFYVFVFFILAGGIIYFTNNLNPRGGVTIDELSQMIQGGTKSEEERVIKGLDSMENEDMLEQDKFLPFVEIGKTLQGKAKELYDNIIVSNYSRNQSQFLKLASGLKPEELSSLFRMLLDNKIDKSSIINDIQNALKDKSITEEKADELSQIVNQIIPK
jgi:hypothetical protein